MQSEQRVARPRKLNLGCGEDIRDGWHNVDVSPDVDPDEVLDLDDRDHWRKLPSNHFDRIVAEHVMEHLREPVMAMREAARTLAPDGTLVVTVPVGINSKTDPTHENRWTWETPRYFAVDGPYSWEAGAELELVERELSIHGHGPFQRISRPLDMLATLWPLWTHSLPGLSGELTATFRGVDR